MLAHCSGESKAAEEGSDLPLRQVRERRQSLIVANQVNHPRLDRRFVDPFNRHIHPSKRLAHVERFGASLFKHGAVVLVRRLRCRLVYALKSATRPPVQRFNSASVVLKTACGVSSADEIWVGFGDRFAEGSLNLFFADAIAAGGDDQNGSVRGAAAKNDRLGDLLDLASDGGGGFRGGSGGGGKLGDFARRAPPFEELFDSLQSTDIFCHRMNIRSGSSFRQGL